MTFFEQLQQHTAADREFLVSAPAIQDALTGRLDRQRYLAFLTQAWHHVRHTVPLLMALGAHLPERHACLRGAVLHYLEEEIGHDEWILNDIAAAGGDPQAVRASTPHVATDALVAYAWDVILRREPVGFFGMVFMLAGTSATLATRAATTIQAALGLPVEAFTYLRSHGELDQSHVQFLGQILEKLAEPADRQAVQQCARAMFWLYGQLFRGLDAIAVAGTPVRKIA